MGNKRKENDMKRKSNNKNSSMEKLKTVLAIGDNMLKKLNGYFLTKR